MGIIVKVYFTEVGKEPFKKWMDALDAKVKLHITSRIDRVRAGNFGDCKKIVGGDIWELRIAYGPGYRVYFGKIGSEIVILLVGGDKGSQLRDIERAKKYWLDYLGKIK